MHPLYSLLALLTIPIRRDHFDEAFEELKMTKRTHGHWPVANWSADSAAAIQGETAGQTNCLRPPTAAVIAPPAPVRPAANAAIAPWSSSPLVVYLIDDRVSQDVVANEKNVALGLCYNNFL